MRDFVFRLNDSSEDWEAVSNEWPVLKSESLEDQAAKVSATKKAFETIRAEHATVLQRVDNLVVSIRQVAEQVEEKERRLQEEFAALQREIDSPGLNLEEFRSRKSRHEQLVKLLKAAGNRKGMAAQALAQVEISARALHDLWRERHREELRKLERKSASLPDSLRLSIDFEGNRDEFRAFLKAKFSGTGFRTVLLDKLVEEFASGFALFQRKAEIDGILGGSADVAKCEELLSGELAEILTYRVPDLRTIRFNGVPIQDLSPGSVPRRCWSFSCRWRAIRSFLSISPKTTSITRQFSDMSWSRYWTGRRSASS